MGPAPLDVVEGGPCGSNANLQRDVLQQRCLGQFRPADCRGGEAKAAAEKVCRSPLVEGEPKPGLLRAKVSPASNPAMKRVFSDPPR
jgi:hypothetical protein